MLYAVFFLPGLIAGLVMFRKSFERSWRFFWSVLLGIYLALWCMPAVLPFVLKLGSLERQYGPVFLLLLMALLFGCILFFGMGALCPEGTDWEYNTAISHFFGFVSSWVVTTVIIGFLFLLLLISPAVQFIPGDQAAPIQKFSCGTLLSFSTWLDRISLQKNTAFPRQEWLDALIASQKSIPKAAPAKGLKKSVQKVEKVQNTVPGAAATRQERKASSAGVPGPGIRRMVAPATERNRQVNQAQEKEL